MEDIEQHNIQIMIKMIIDKLYNNTLKDYYTKISKEQDERLGEQDKLLGEQGKRLGEQDVLLSQKKIRIGELNNEIQNFKKQLRDKKVGDAEKVELQRKIANLEKEVTVQKQLHRLALQVRGVETPNEPEPEPEP